MANFEGGRDGAEGILLDKRLHAGMLLVLAVVQGGRPVDELLDERVLVEVHLIAPSFGPQDIPVGALVEDIGEVAYVLGGTLYIGWLVDRVDEILGAIDATSDHSLAPRLPQLDRLLHLLLAASHRRAEGVI